MSAEFRALVADAAKRLVDARLGQSIAVGDAAYRERRWAAARDAYRSVQRQAQSGDIATPRVRDGYAQIPEQLKEARLNIAITEKHFSDALAIDPRNQTAVTGVRRGLAAYRDGSLDHAVAVCSTF